MNDSPDFFSTARHLMDEAQSLGAVFNPDGTWTMDAGHAPLPTGLVDRLRVHRAAIAALDAEEEQPEPPEDFQRIHSV